MPGFYETAQAVTEYLLFHYGDDRDVLPWDFGPRDALGFAARTVSECLIPERLPPLSRALDLGCAVGRSAFELTRHCEHVVAIDTSSAFIAAARQMQELQRLSIDVVREGRITETVTVRLPAHTRPSHVAFHVGNALHPDAGLGFFDVIHAANLLDRVPQPRELLAICASRLAPGGQLILTSPYTWLSDYTDPADWLCADGRPTSIVLAEHLPDLHLERRRDLPFLIREHSRKYQWSVAEATVWVRRA